MTYLPFIDIIQSNLIRNKDDEFLYSVIFLLDDPALSPDGQSGFGIEMDVNLDGRGDSPRLDAAAKKHRMVS